MTEIVSEGRLGEIILGMPAEEYHQRSLDVATSSGLRILATKTPAHYRAYIERHDEEETPAKLLGHAYHCRVLEPDLFAKRYCSMPAKPPRDLRHLRDAAKPSQSTLDSIAWWDSWDADHAGMTVLTADQFAQIEAMYDALMRHPVAAGIMASGQSEVTLQWVDVETGVRCKARADWRRPGQFLMDLKTTDDASPDAFAKSVHKYGYHIQSAHYTEGSKACGDSIENFLILAQEKEYPYLPAVYAIDAAAEVRGYEIQGRAMRTLRDCINNDKWPGYHSGISQLSLPAYALKD